MASLRSILAGALALGLVAAACGNDETAATEAASPLSEFLGEDLWGGDFNEEDFAAEQRLREEKIAACMAEQGFEYIPVDPGQFDIFDGEPGLDYESREYAEKYGFGVTTERFSQAEVGPDLIGYDDSAFEQFEDDGGFVDPNQEIIEAMDPGSQEAYYAALYGDEDDFFPEIDDTMSDEEVAALEDDFSFEPTGCQGEVWADEANNAFYQEFDSELTEMYQAAQDDPRVKAAEQEISDCVADEGLEFTGFDEDIWTRWEDDLFAIEEMIGGFPGENLTEEDFNAMSEQELNDLFSQPREFTDEARSRLATIQAEEIKLATTVWDCGGGFEAQEKLFQEVMFEYEQQFIDTNADRLSEFKANPDS